MESVRLVLASGSTRRAELLRTAGMFFDAIPAGVHEAMDSEETPDGYVRRVAQLKAEAVWSRAAGRPVLGAETVVLVDNHVLGKPQDGDEARRMLRMLSGRGHLVMTGICLIAPAAASGRAQMSVSRTKVELSALTDEEIAWYVATGEPIDHVGAYAIQGLAVRFVTRVEGSWSNVLGLPIEAVYDLCKRAGLLTLN